MLVASYGRHWQRHTRFTDILLVVFRKSSFVNEGSSAVVRNQHLDAKRIKTDGQVLVEKTTCTGKMIEIDLVSSDEDI